MHVLQTVVVSQTQMKLIRTAAPQIPNVTFHVSAKYKQKLESGHCGTICFIANFAHKEAWTTTTTKQQQQQLYYNVSFRMEGLGRLYLGVRKREGWAKLSTGGGTMGSKEFAGGRRSRSRWMECFGEQTHRRRNIYSRIRSKGSLMSLENYQKHDNKISPFEVLLH